jgi:hypothetical protein
MVSSKCPPNVETGARLCIEVAHSGKVTYATHSASSADGWFEGIFWQLMTMDCPLSRNYILLSDGYRPTEREISTAIPETSVDFSNSLIERAQLHPSLRPGELIDGTSDPCFSRGIGGGTGGIVFCRGIADSLGPSGISRVRGSAWLFHCGQTALLASFSQRTPPRPFRHRTLRR